MVKDKYNSKLKSKEYKHMPDYFEYCDAFIILTRQGLVLTSNDTLITFDEDEYLSNLNHRLIERKAKGGF